jgi:hypothetical protein
MGSDRYINRIMTFGPDDAFGVVAYEPSSDGREAGVSFAIGEMRQGQGHPVSHWPYDDLTLWEAWALGASLLDAVRYHNENAPESERFIFEGDLP